MFIASGPEYQSVVFYSYYPKGRLAVKKASVAPSITDNNDNYSLYGIMFSIEHESHSPTYKFLVTGDEKREGRGKYSIGVDPSTGEEFVELEPGRYIVKEGNAGHEWLAIDGREWLVEVKPNETAWVNA